MALHETIQGTTLTKESLIRRVKAERKKMNEWLHPDVSDLSMVSESDMLSHSVAKMAMWIDTISVAKKYTIEKWRQCRLTQRRMDEFLIL